MNFKNRLDFLMNLTKTTNISLAKYVALDPSYISRLRNGCRIPSSQAEYLKSMSYFFSKKIIEPYQYISLKEVLNLEDNFPQDIKYIEKRITEWLSNNLVDKKEPIEKLLNEFSNFNFKSTNPMPIKQKAELMPLEKKAINIQYGATGKRETVLEFLQTVMNTNKPQTLLLFSDEEISWLTENPAFTARWSSLLYSVILNGNKLKIIHTVNRNLDEMINSISQWLPLYMTGSISPYYYPRVRDGVFKRTLFIAPETCALVSTSIGEDTTESANILFTDNKVISSFNKEFDNYLSLCRPLMKIYTGKEQSNSLELLLEFEQTAHNTVLLSDTLSLLTIPIEIIKQVLDRTNIKNQNFIINLHKKRTQTFKNNLCEYTFTEILNLPKKKEIESGKIPISFFYLINKDLPYYTVDEYKKHLQNIITLLKEHSNYNVIINNTIEIKTFSLYLKENLGVIIAKLIDTPITFAISESNMVASFWDYIVSKCTNIKKEEKNKDKVIEKLQHLIDQL